MTSLVLRRFQGLFLSLIYQKIVYLKSVYGISNFIYKVNTFPNLLKDIKEFVLMCKTFKRKKVKLKKHKFWKKWKARRNTRKKNKNAL